MLQKFTIDDIVSNIDKPVCLSVIKELISNEILPLPDKLRFSLYKPEYIPNKKEGQARSKKVYQRGLLSGDNVMSVLLERDNQEDIHPAIKRAHLVTNKLLFDKELDWHAEVAHRHQVYNLNIALRSSSYEYLTDLSESIRNTVSEGHDTFLHSVNYDITLPIQLALYVDLYHEYRERIGGYNQTLEEYVHAIADKGLATTTDITGSVGELRFKQSQIDVLGMIQEDSYLPAVEEIEENVFALSINYKLYFDKPIFWKFRSVLSAHNKLLPKALIINSKVKREGGVTSSIHNLIREGWDSNQLLGFGRTTYPVIVPEQEDRLIGHNQVGYTNLLQTLVFYNEEDLNDKRLLNVNSLADKNLSKYFSPYLKARKDPKELLHKFNSLFFFQLFINGEPKSPKKLSLTSEGMLSYTGVLNPRDVHHICLYGLNDIQLYSSKLLLADIKDHVHMASALLRLSMDNNILPNFIFSTLFGLSIGDKFYKPIATELGMDVVRYVLWEDGVVVNHDLDTDDEVIEYVRKRIMAGGLSNTKMMIPKTVQLSAIHAMLKR